MHIPEQIPIMHGFHRIHHILGIAGIRIQRNTGHHTADFEIRIDPVPFLYHQGAGNQFMMYHLVHALLRMRIVVKYHSGTGIAKQRVLVIFLVVNFIEGHPVLHLIFIPFHDCKGIFHKKINHLPVFPAAVILHQMIRNFKMGKGYHRLYSIFQKFVKELVIEHKPLLIRRLFVTLRKNPRPRNGGAQTLESHLRQKLDIFLIFPIKIRSLMVRIIISFQNPVRYLTIHSVGPGGKHIGNAYTFASLIPSAFYLMGGNSASPQKILR